MAQANPLYGTENFSTTLNVGGGIDDSQTTGIVLTSVSGLNTNGGVLGLTWSSTLDTSTYEEIIYTGVSGNELTGVTRASAGTSAKSHNNGATVVAVVSSIHNNRIADKLRSVDEVLAQDPNNNEIIETTYVSSAVNEIQVSNAATGNPPAIAATGGDTNIDLKLTPKGSGAITVPSGTYETNVTADDDIPNKKYVDDRTNTDGWTAANETWTYASASTFTVAGVDVTTKYTKGTRLKFTQTSVKYAVVVASSFSTDTTVTIAVNTDYTIANAAISSNYYSYQANPAGYPDWFNDTTGFDLEFGGSNTANTTITKCKFRIDGKRFEGVVMYQFTGDPGSGNLTMSPPVSPLDSYQIAGIGRYWNLSVRAFLWAETVGADVYLVTTNGTVMTDAAPSTIANGHDLECSIFYDYA